MNESLMKLNDPDTANEDAGVVRDVDTPSDLLTGR